MFSMVHTEILTGLQNQEARVSETVIADPNCVCETTLPITQSAPTSLSTACVITAAQLKTCCRSPPINQPERGAEQYSAAIPAGPQLKLTHTLRLHHYECLINNQFSVIIALFSLKCRLLPCYDSSFT